MHSPLQRDFSSNFLHTSSETNYNNDTIKCDTFLHKNLTLHLSEGWEGIPENLLLNFVAWMLLLMLFTCLRKSAWNYGRIALVQRSEDKWTHLFYGEGRASAQQLGNEEDSIDSIEVTLHLDKGFCSWLRAVFHIKDEHILKKNGTDALQYLSFQRHMIVYMIVVCVTCLGIVLPANCQGDLGGASTFSQTTLSNLKPDSSLLWVHVALSFLFVPICIFFLRHFSNNLKIEDEENLVSRTLMVVRIPKDYCYKNCLFQHFQEAYPECVVQDVQFAYDVKKLNQLDTQRELAVHAKIWCETVVKETGMRPKMRPYVCGRFCCCGSMVDALEYYTEEEHALSSAVDREKSTSLLKPLGIAFITFQTENMAEIVYKDHQEQCKCTSNPPSSSLSCHLNPHNWNVYFAPSPDDIFWENLRAYRGFRQLTVIAINIIVFILLFFLTTPAIIVNNLNILRFQEKMGRLSPIFSQFVPTLLMLTVAVLLPTIVNYADRFIYHWTRSARNYSIMRKTFTLLLFMVVILPSLQLTSAKALLEWAFKPQNETYRWQCIFLPDSGAFFVNYVTTCGFIGSALELIRFPELFVYALYVCFSRSKAEHVGVRKAILYEFEFGVQYAWFLLIFAVVIIYSLSCPLIVPFGLFSMCMKHAVDRYNIYFAYGPSKINKNIHAAAITFVVISLTLLQVSLFFFSFLRNGWSNITLVSLAVFLLTLMVFFAQLSLHWFQELSPIAYKKLARNFDADANNQSPREISPISEQGIDQAYIPTVLKRQSSRTDVYTTNSLGRTYGTSEGSVIATPERDDVPLPGSDYNQLEEPYQRY